jgi:heterodisulfide reductase subunit A-like polyferredoxin
MKDEISRAWVFSSANAAAKCRCSGYRDAHQRALENPEVVYQPEAYPCSKDGQARLHKAIIDQDLIVFDRWLPRLVEVFRQAVSQAGSFFLECVTSRAGGMFTR